MKILYIFLFLIISCSQTKPKAPTEDVFDSIMAVMESRSLEDLYTHFGHPDEVMEESTPRVLKYQTPLIDVYLNEKSQISHVTLFYWKDFDNYAALKSRFNKYTWIETKLADNSSGDVLTDLRLVRVPKINMEFQYDNYSPKRKVMWILFE